VPEQSEFLAALQAALKRFDEYRALWKRHGRIPLLFAHRKHKEQYFDEEFNTSGSYGAAQLRQKISDCEELAVESRPETVPLEEIRNTFAELLAACDSMYKPEGKPSDQKCKRAVDRLRRLLDGKSVRPRRGEIDWRALEELAMRKRGNTRKFLQLLAEKRADIPIADLAVTFDWRKPFDGSWDGLRARVLAAIGDAKLPYQVHRVDNCARISIRKGQKRTKKG
jgi:hypothetical protein